MTFTGPQILLLVLVLLSHQWRLHKLEKHIEALESIGVPEEEV
jgi:hypothetical protein